MTDNDNLFEPLFKRAEKYTQGNIELLKLRAIDKTTHVTSLFLSRMVPASIFLIFLLVFNTGLALLIGEKLGQNYLGFFIVAAFYAILGVIFLIISPFIKKHINNSMISEILN